MQIRLLEQHIHAGITRAVDDVIEVSERAARWLIGNGRASLHGADGDAVGEHAEDIPANTESDDAAMGQDVATTGEENHAAE